METEKKKILILGNDANAFALIKKLKSCNYVGEIFVAPATDLMSDFVTSVDIREDKIDELLTFAVKNSINMTIVTSKIAIEADVAGLFAQNNQAIFSPTASAGEFALDKAFCKKFLYQLHIPTPKFAVFEKEQLALNYIQTSKMPVIISGVDVNKKRYACSTVAVARNGIEDLFFAGESKVVIEEFLYGHEFTQYYITDGYKALPITSVANYKFKEDGDGGLLTNGVGCYTPDFVITKDIENKIADYVNKILIHFEAEGSPYMGILGVDCILEGDDKFSVLEFSPFFKPHDANAVLNIVSEDLYKIFEACINGYFADDYEEFRTSDFCSVSCVVMSLTDGKIIKGLDILEDNEFSLYGVKKDENSQILSSKGQKLIITKTAKTLSRARDSLYEDINFIDFSGKIYRKDICSYK